MSNGSNPAKNFAKHLRRLTLTRRLERGAVSSEPHSLASETTGRFYDQQSIIIASELDAILSRQQVASIKRVEHLILSLFTAAKNNKSGQSRRLSSEISEFI